MVKGPIQSCSASYGAHLELFPMLRICGFHFELHDIDELVDIARRLVTRLARSERSDENIQGKNIKPEPNKKNVFFGLYIGLCCLFFSIVSII